MRLSLIRRFAADAKAATKPKQAWSGRSQFFGVMGSVAAVGLCTPHFWLNLASMKNMVGDNPDRDHNQANKVQENLRAARRGSLKEFKEAYYGRVDEHDYKPGAYWDRFNNNTITDQRHNPNNMTRKASGNSKPVGLYDTVGAVDKSRTKEGNEYYLRREYDHEVGLAHKK